ncbi:MAG: serine protease [Candidatus Saccharibacteria bacterium]|nr:serine protease [Candidatus Saccharibacteria bacterium]
MNALDFALIVMLLGFFVAGRSMGFVYYLFTTGGLFAGYLLGLLIAPIATRSFTSDVAIASVSLGLMFGLASALCYIGGIIGKRVRLNVILSRFNDLDKLLVWPYKVAAALVGIVVLSQTLIHVPLLSLQFSAQGSSILYLADKIGPATSFEQLGHAIAPDQFRNLRLDYDANPLTFNHIADAGEFQNAVRTTADSIVKISGRNCVGLGSGSGFVAAPGLIVTNAHVIGGASSIYIRNHSGAYPATPIIIDEDHDLAVLYSKFINSRPLPFSATLPTRGDKAVIVGYPGGGDLKMSQGIIYDRDNTSTHNKLNGSTTLTLNAGLGPGSSGGPVLNLAGEVIGVNDAGGSDHSIAIKAELAKSLVSKAAKKPFPTRVNFCAVAPKFY